MSWSALLYTAARSWYLYKREYKKTSIALSLCICPDTAFRIISLLLVYINVQMIAASIVVYLHICYFIWENHEFAFNMMQTPDSYKKIYKKAFLLQLQICFF